MSNSFKYTRFSKDEAACRRVQSPVRPDPSEQDFSSGEFKSNELSLLADCRNLVTGYRAKK
jgi:hypothetical protein